MNSKDSNKNNYVGPPYRRAEMYAGRVACCPWWVRMSMLKRDRKTDGRQIVTLHFPLDAASVKRNPNPIRSPRGHVCKPVRSDIQQQEFINMPQFRLMSESCEITHFLFGISVFTVDSGWLFGEMLVSGCLSVLVRGVQQAIVCQSGSWHRRAALEQLTGNSRQTVSWSNVACLSVTATWWLIHSISTLSIHSCPTAHHRNSPQFVCTWFRSQIFSFISRHVEPRIHPMFVIIIILYLLLFLCP